ncbi:hypothetical protein MMC11_004324 [Xylographa trunciseda]|nr:hypothetical protein [Xylographa trunciseda]
MQHDEGLITHQFTVPDLEDEFEQFRIWVRNVGACAADHASLDFRLRDVAATRTTVLTILSGLQSSLLHCSSIVTGQRPPYKIQEGFDDSGSEAGSDKLSGMQSSVEDKVTLLDSELDVRFEDVVESINKLAQIAFVIRKSSGWSRYARGAAFEEWQDGINKSAIFEQYIAKVLQFRLATTNPNVRMRLVAAISQRRRQFAYFRRHQQKLFYGTSDTFRISKDQAKRTLAESSGNPGEIRRGSDRPGSSTAKLSAPSLLLSQTTASTLHPELFARDNRSSISSGSSRSLASGQVDASLPPPPAYNKNDRKHVIADLRPYVCVFDDCQDLDLNLESEDDWIEHEKWQHNLVWCCDGFEHPPETFRTRDNFENHMKLQHGDTFQASQLGMLAKISAKPSSDSFQHCPFCDYSNEFEAEALGQNRVDTRARSRHTSMRVHITSHLLSIFLLALPERDDLLDDESMPITSTADARSIQSLIDVELSFRDDNFIYDSVVAYNQPLALVETADEDWAFTRPEYETPESDPVLTSIAEYVRTHEDVARVSSPVFQTDQLQQISIQRYGITEVYAPTPPFSAQVDLVLVHGLEGHPEHTWTSPNKVFWPKDLLPSYIDEQRIRVLVYGYSADAESRMASAPIHNQAERLLVYLHANRRVARGADNRPILFLAHSYGGFIVISALSILRARELSADDRSLFTSTYGILFLGKPNYRPGIELDRWTNCLERLYTITSQNLDLEDTQQTLQSLQTNSSTIREIESDFLTWMSRFHIYFFYEMRFTTLNGSPQYIVDEELAAPLDMDCERAGIMADHVHMCQFDDKGSPGFIFVVEAIRRCAKDSVEVINARWVAEHELVRNKPESSDPEPEPSLVLPQSFRPDTALVGREDELQELERLISQLSQQGFQTGPDGYAVLIYGQAGVGKSALVRQYCWQTREKFPGGVFWFEGSSISQLRIQLQTAVQRNVFSHTPWSGRSDDINIADARAWFEERSDWLIVYDCFNIDGPFQDLLPAGRNSCIMCISGSPVLEEYFKNVSLPRILVPPLKPAAARALLLRELFIESPTEAHAAYANNVISKVGCIPLTIVDIAHRMQAKGQSLEQFDPDLEPDSHIFKQYGPVLAELRKKNLLEAINLLNVLSLFETEIRLRMIILGHRVLQGLNVETQPSSLGSPPDIHQTIDILRAYGLLVHETQRRDSDLREWKWVEMLKMHSDLQKFCVERQRQEGYFQVWIAHAVRLFNESYSELRSMVESGRAPEAIQQLQEYLKHGQRLRALLDTCNTSEKRDLKPLCDELDLRLAHIQTQIDARDRTFLSTIIESPETAG